MLEQQTLFDMPSALEVSFREFHQANPTIWELFQRYTFEVIRAGHRHYSSRTVLHRIRWHTNVETRSDENFKINNNHSPYYGRLFMETHPEHDGFFHTRGVRGE